MPAGAYDPCIDGEVSAYFNRVDVQAAFHANSSGNRLPYAWESCSSKVLYSRFASHPISCSHRVLTLLQSRLAKNEASQRPTPLYKVLTATLHTCPLYRSIQGCLC